MVVASDLLAFVAREYTVDYRKYIHNIYTWRVFALLEHKLTQLLLDHYTQKMISNHRAFFAVLFLSSATTVVIRGFTTAFFPSRTKRGISHVPFNNPLYERNKNVAVSDSSVTPSPPNEKKEEVSLVVMQTDDPKKDSATDIRPMNETTNSRNDTNNLMPPRKQHHYFMQQTVELVLKNPQPYDPRQAPMGAILVAKDGTTLLGQGVTTYRSDAVQACLEQAIHSDKDPPGNSTTSQQQTSWLLFNFLTQEIREKLQGSTLYVTMEPTLQSSVMEFILESSLLSQVVIGCGHPLHQSDYPTARALDRAGIQVHIMNHENNHNSDDTTSNTASTIHEECLSLIQEYAQLQNSKFMKQARQHFQQFQKPLGLLHCSVIDSDDMAAFARRGNALPMAGTLNLSYRNFGSYEIAPPPEVVWAEKEEYDDFSENGMIMDAEFDEEEFYDSEEYKYDDATGIDHPAMPWYEQADACVATFPGPGNGGPSDDENGDIANRLNGLKWLATYGEKLPPSVERILVLDATDLPELPLSNEDPNRPSIVDLDAFWKGEGRKPTRVLLRRGSSAQARAAANVAKECARMAAEFAEQCAQAIESGEAFKAAEMAIQSQKNAEIAAEKVQKELQKTRTLRNILESKGVVVETLDGHEPIDVMKHLGKRNGYQSVVWRAGCWGERGVRSILAGAFQWVSAHIAVDAVGGKFWQLMLAENAVQAACGPARKVKVFADQEDLSLDYCDQPDADNECVTRFDGRPVRHIRLDCRVALVDEKRPREFRVAKTKKLDKKHIEEEAPWFL